MVSTLAGSVGNSGTVEVGRVGTTALLNKKGV